jgi:transposase
VGARSGTRLDITIVRLPAYSPDFMPVEALWRWLRESVTYNHCHDTAAELIERVAAFVTEINGTLVRSPIACG